MCLLTSKKNIRFLEIEKVSFVLFFKVLFSFSCSIRNFYILLCTLHTSGISSILIYFFDNSTYIPPGPTVFLFFSCFTVFFYFCLSSCILSASMHISACVWGWYPCLCSIFVTYYPFFVLVPFEMDYSVSQWIPFCY